MADSTNAEELLNKITGAVRECAKIILEAKRSSEMVEAKGGHANFVTTYDKKVQEELKKKLMAILPEANFAGEEEEEFNVKLEGLTYVVDPIDGTTNFIHDLHCSCISVGLLNNGKQFIGVVYNPYLDEMFTAIKDGGAFLNGKRIEVTKSPLEAGLSIFGTSPYYIELAKKSFDLAYKIFEKSADVRRGGSAAIDLCTVAAGRANMYFELKLSPWDFAAGTLIVREAGGIATTAEGSDFDFTKKCSCVARTVGMEDVIEEIFFKG